MPARTRAMSPITVAATPTAARIIREQVAAVA
jgi:hypothetical protein